MRTPFLLALLVVWSVTSARADYTVDFVRIACIQDAQFMDVEYRGIHSPTITALTERDEGGKSVLAQHGFFDPSKLSYECSLPESKYVVSATQADWSEGRCGAAPQIGLSFYRNGEPLLDGVVFGPSCFGNPSVTRITVEDGKQGWYAREVEVCFDSGSSEEPGRCIDLEDGLRKLPIRQDDIKALLK